MVTKESYYRCAGYYSLPFAAVPLLAVSLLGCLGTAVPLFFGSLGFWFALAGLTKGDLVARLCGLISLLMFAHIALVFVSNHFF